MVIVPADPEPEPPVEIVENGVLLLVGGGGELDEGPN
jgi:hypothetical protein